MVYVWRPKSQVDGWFLEIGGDQIPFILGPIKRTFILGRRKTEGLHDHIAKANCKGWKGCKAISSGTCLPKTMRPENERLGPENVLSRNRKHIFLGHVDFKGVKRHVSKVPETKGWNWWDGYGGVWQLWLPRKDWWSPIPQRWFDRSGGGVLLWCSTGPRQATRHMVGRVSWENQNFCVCLVFKVSLLTVSLHDEFMKARVTWYDLIMCVYFVVWPTWEVTCASLQFIASAAQVLGMEIWVVWNDGILQVGVNLVNFIAFYCECPCMPRIPNQSGLNHQVTKVITRPPFLRFISSWFRSERAEELGV